MGEERSLKEFILKHQGDIILVIGVILISLLSFAMGYILAKQEVKEPLEFKQYESSYYRSWDIRPLFGLETGRKR